MLDHLKIIGVYCLMCLVGVVVASKSVAEVADRCSDILSNGIRDTYKFKSNTDFFSEFSRLLNMTDEQIENEVKEKKVEAGFAYKVIAFKLSASSSTEHFEQLKKSLTTLEQAWMSSSEAISIQQAIVNKDVVKAWLDCMALKKTTDIRHSVIDNGGEVIALTIWWEGDAELKLPKIQDFFVIGGEVAEKLIFKKDVEITRSPLSQIIRRRPESDLTIVLNSDKRGTVVVNLAKPSQDRLNKEIAALKDAILKSQTDLVTEKSKVVAAEAMAKAEAEKARKLAEENAARELKEREGERITQVRYSNVTSDDKDAGTDANFFILLASKTGEGTISLGNAAGNDNEKGGATDYGWKDVEGNVQVISLSNITLGHDNKHKKAGWKPKSIIIRAKTSLGRELVLVNWENQKNQWWADSEGDRQIQRSLTFSKPLPFSKP